jgi:diguanylate cyclase (GGDEF)-like protein
VAGLLVASARSEDTVGRLGGEEFAVIAPGADLPAATTLAERLRADLASTPMAAGGRTFNLTLSVGCTVWDGREEVSALMSRVDALLYQAKNLGRNRVVASDKTVTSADGGSRGHSQS